MGGTDVDSLGMSHIYARCQYRQIAAAEKALSRDGISAVAGIAVFVHRPVS